VSMQEKGYRTRACLAFEQEYKTLPETPRGMLLPVNRNTVSGSRNQNASETLTGRRDPVEPDQGYLDVSGSLVVPVDAHAFGLHLRSMFGEAQSAVVPAVALCEGMVLDLGSGKVGLPCLGHGLAAGAPVLLTGTEQYDGAYVLEPETTDSLLVIRAGFAEASAVTSAATVTLARQVQLDVGAVSDLGNGCVGLPSTGHGLPVGAEIELAGSAHYDGTHLLVRGTSANRLVIEADFTAEELDGMETATARLRDHVFTVQDAAMPSFTLEKAFPSIPVYLRSRGCKINQFSMTLGGDGELTASLDIKGAAEDKAVAVLDGTAVRWPFVRFKQFQAGVSESGVVRSGRFTELQMTLGFNLDDDTYTLGDGGERGDLGEGVISLSGNLTGLFKDSDYLDKALSGTVTNFSTRLVNGGYRLVFDFEEVLLARTSPKVEGSKGVKESFDWSAFYNSGASDTSVKVTLRNEIANWEV